MITVRFWSGSSPNELRCESLRVIAAFEQYFDFVCILPDAGAAFSSVDDISGHTGEQRLM